MGLKRLDADAHPSECLMLWLHTRDRPVFFSDGFFNTKIDERLLFEDGSIGQDSGKREVAGCGCRRWEVTNMKT